MKIALFGYGRIGRRHFANLREADLVGEVMVYDPASHPTKEPGVLISDSALGALEWADAAIIATPASEHAFLMLACAERGVPFLVEKPPVAVDQAYMLESIVNAAEGLPCAVGFNYRFHHVVQSLMAAPDRLECVYEFEARDDLVGHYGRTVVETMASHAVDIALYLGGEVVRCSLRTDGVEFAGTIEHLGGARSLFDQRMNRGPRLSRVSDRLLYPDDEMYRLELRTWLDWVRGGKHDPRTATLTDGLEVMDVLSKVQVVEAVA